MRPPAAARAPGAAINRGSTYAFSHDAEIN
jgi:hypothetical protein